jgi:hypothetical protein
MRLLPDQLLDLTPYELDRARELALLAETALRKGLVI